ncbi:sugar phosphate isomerase/epimerase family protein [Halopelagius longus]|uniref:Sugar phosphate isomerase/epimerase n=1 Tax=Halopelagius longus TaxID=1236180 RepID=A0A1H1FRY2_9EURY|nr:sugar phosphate isomerase/epimerase [Halopelagius longus]RDI70191.1 sugar phosphate isomerase/epimerase [Halopelagius longus]SDR03651.1 Sugar phosphate isomerase/epimerase [Halopelagius longus]
MTEFGFQLYSLHDIEDPLPTVIGRVGDAGFDGVEFAGLGETDVGDVQTALSNADLSPAGAHVGLEELEANLDEVAETYRALDCEEIAVPWLDPEHFESADAVESAGERLSAVAADLADRDLTLHYHNHDQEFAEVGGEPALTRLLEVATDLRLELDLGWAGAAGYDPLSFLDDHADRVDIVHLKDYDAAAGDPVAVGDGDLDLEATVSRVRDGGFDWLVYEAEERPDSYETLDRAADVLDTYW